MYFVYILYSKSSGRHYVGSTSDVEKRLKRHNAGSSKSTKPYRPWVIVYQEEYDNNTEARKRENQIKKYKGGEAFKKLLSSNKPT